MKQTSLGLGSSTKRTRKREFLAEMERVVPWSALVERVAPFAPDGRRGRPPFSLETMLRIHFMQQWFTLSDPAMEEALHDMPLFRDFAGLGGWCDRLPDETTILRFRHLLENNKLPAEILKTLNNLLHSKGLLLKAGTVVDATLIAAPSRIGLVHTVRGTSGNVNGVVQADALLHGQETEAFADAGYQGVDKRDAADPEVRLNVAMRPGKRKGLDKIKTVGQLKDRLEKLKVSIRAKVEHPFRLIKRVQTAVCVRPPRRRDRRQMAFKRPPCGAPPNATHDDGESPNSIVVLPMSPS